MSSRRKTSTRQSLQSFVREYTAGVDEQGLKRLFDREAAQVFEVLTRDQGLDEPSDPVHRWLLRAKRLFLGISYKLSPPRRVLFAVSMLAFFVSCFGTKLSWQSGGGRKIAIDIAMSPFWATAAVAGLVFLLALELVDRIRVRDELEVARQLQRDLLPKEAPLLPGWSFAHSYRTANEVGGDYYDFLPIPNGQLALVVGDASGHGMAAGLVMAIANATLRTALDIDPSCNRVLALVNRTICRTGDRRTFMSLFYGLLDPATGGLEFCLAGHPFPYLRHLDGSVEELGEGSLPLGLRDPLETCWRQLNLAPGEVLLLYSDGLPEALSPQGEAFGFERLRQLLAAGGSSREVHDRIVEAFSRHVGDNPLKDDLTLVVVGRLPAA